MSTPIARPALTPWLALESALLFLALPGAVIIGHLNGVRSGFIALFAAMVYCLWQLQRSPSFPTGSLVTLRHLGKELPGILFRFLIGGGILTLIMWRFGGDWFLYFPRERLGLWAAVMVLYPILSVYPQEIIYRAFIGMRCEQLAPGNVTVFVIFSTLAYALVHAIYLNFWGPLLTLAGGVMFARTYLKHRSLAGVTVEHALWGDLIFTLGLGRFFYSGNIG